MKNTCLILFIAFSMSCITSYAMERGGQGGSGRQWDFHYLPYVPEPATRSSQRAAQIPGTSSYLLNPPNPSGSRQNPIIISDPSSLSRQQEVELPQQQTVSTSSTSSTLPYILEQLSRRLNEDGQGLLRRIWHSRLSPWQQDQIIEQLETLYNKLRSEASPQDALLIMLKKLSLLIRTTVNPDSLHTLTLNLTRLHWPDTRFELEQIGNDVETLTLTQEEEPFLIEVDAVILKNRLPHLKKLHLKNLALTPEKLRVLLAAFPNIMSLTITGTPITDELLSVLIKSTAAQNITELNLGGTFVPPALLETLKR